MRPMRLGGPPRLGLACITCSLAWMDARGGVLGSSSFGFAPQVAPNEGGQHHDAPMHLLRLALLCACALASACQGPRASTAPVTSEAQLAQSLFLLDAKFEGEGAARVLTFTARNEGKQSLACATRVEWYGRDGAVLVGQPGTEVQLALGPGDSVPVRIAGVPSGAVSWRLRVAGN